MVERFHKKTIHFFVYFFRMSYNLKHFEIEITSVEKIKKKVPVPKSSHTNSTKTDLVPLTSLLDINESMSPCLGIR